MSLTHALARVMDEYPLVRPEPFKGHLVANLLRVGVPDEVRAALGASTDRKVKGSAGQGSWASVPWVAVFDPLITLSAKGGTYVVYLFDAQGERVHLSLNQGTTLVRVEHGNRAPQVLRDRARLMRSHLPTFANELPISAIALGSESLLATDYEAGHALGVTYERDDLPSEAVLREHLSLAVRAHLALRFNTGAQEPGEEDLGDTPIEVLLESRRYALHRRIERNAKGARLAKRHFGHRCQACSMSFAECYGSIGDGFIEAHHRRPLSSLDEGTVVRYDVAADFAVLCANCHRMIHRMPDPNDLDTLRDAIEEARAIQPTQP